MKLLHDGSVAAVPGSPFTVDVLPMSCETSTVTGLFILRFSFNCILFFSFCSCLSHFFLVVVAAGAISRKSVNVALTALDSASARVRTGGAGVLLKMMLDFCGDLLFGSCSL